MTIPSEVFWSLAQAIAWICTRDSATVGGISEPHTIEALKAQLLKYRAGYKCTVRRFSNGTERRRVTDVGHSNGLTGTDALQLLQEAVLGGDIRMIARSVETGARGPIPENERATLVLRIFPDDPIRPYGFYSKHTKECRWIEPLLSSLDVQRLAPVLSRPPTNTAEHRIYNRLLEITAGRVLTKPNAKEDCEKVDGYFRNGFERAWKKLPAERKRRRGDHGPRTGAARKSHV